MARALDWHVREQVEFNRNVMSCVEATLEALERNQARYRRMAPMFEPLQHEAAELKDIRVPLGGVAQGMGA